MAEPITGLLGNVSVAGAALADVRNWKVDRKNPVKKYSSSTTAGYTKTAKGVNDYTLTFSIYLQDGELNIGFAEGDLIAFVGMSYTGKTLTCNARVNQISEAVDIEGANMEAADVTCDGDGSYTIA